MVKFNYGRLFNDLEAKRRRSNGLSWNKVCVRNDIHPTTINRFLLVMRAGNETALSVDTLVKLLEWLKIYDIQRYLLEPGEAADPIKEEYKDGSRRKSTK